MLERAPQLWFETIGSPPHTEGADPLRALPRFLSDLFEIRRDELPKLVALPGLFFLVVCTVGILKPIRNAFALDGLADTQFYKVYLVSAAVVLFVPAYNRLANRVPWRWLISMVALFFVGNLWLFRAFYREGSAAFGMLFYGWYDLYAAVMVTQFFMATQLFFNAREAKRLYPFAIAGGSLGAVLGAAITGFFAERVGTPNLLLVASGFVFVFAVALPFVWAAETRRLAPEPKARREGRLTAGEFRTVLRDRQVLLIAAAVLLTVLVKQLVDYQFNTITKEVFETRDAISAFQGKLNVAIQWLPIVVLVALRPILQHWGVGLVVLLLPVGLLAANLGLALSWSLVAAVTARVTDNGLRYTAERAGREILYVPVPESIKLKAKAYIDVAVEKGLGKMLSAGVIFVALMLMDYRRVAFVAVGLAAVWLAVALAVRREYVRTLARAIQGRFASFEGVFASIADASTFPVVRRALLSGDARQAAFALDLIDQADPASTRPLAGDLHALLDHPSASLRERALIALAAFPEAIDSAKVREKLRDPVEPVREAAVRALCAARPADSERLLLELLGSEEAPVRMAGLAWLAEEGREGAGAGWIGESYLAGRLEAARSGEADARVEVALAAGAMGDDPRVPELLGPLLRDPDPRVAGAALRSAGRLGRREFVPRMIAALKTPATREAAREGLVRQGERVVGTLSDYLRDPTVDPVARRNIPAVLARIPAQSSVDALLRALEPRSSDRLLFYRTLKALNKLRARGDGLSFDASIVWNAAAHEVDLSSRYVAARASLESLGSEAPAVALLQKALREAWFDARERLFRCLALLHPPDGVYRAYVTIASGGPAAQANASEWLEQTVGHTAFRRIAAAVGSDEGAPGRPPQPREALRDLWRGGEPWLAAAAAWAAAGLGGSWARQELEKLRSSPDLGLRAVAGRALARLAEDVPGRPQRPPTRGGESEMNLIEKVFLLQQVDLLHDARTEDLALLASIAEEVEVEPGTVLVRQDEPADALYVVIRGAVELRRAGEQVLTAQDGTPFGTWALIDEAPSLIDATAVRDTQLLRITRPDFYDLLADHHELVRGLLQGLARRVRTLVT